MFLRSRFCAGCVEYRSQEKHFRIIRLRNSNSYIPWRLLLGCIATQGQLFRDDELRHTSSAPDEVHAESVPGRHFALYNEPQVRAPALQRVYYDSSRSPAPLWISTNLNHCSRCFAVSREKRTAVCPLWLHESKVVRRRRRRCMFPSFSPAFFRQEGRGSVHPCWRSESLGCSSARKSRSFGRRGGRE